MLGHMPDRKEVSEQMKRTTLILPERIWKELKHQSVDEGRQLTELVKEALDEYLKRKKQRR